MYVCAHYYDSTCTGNWVHHICDQLRVLRTTAECGSLHQQAAASMTEGSFPCPPGTFTWEGFPQNSRVEWLDAQQNITEICIYMYLIHEF